MSKEGDWTAATDSKKRSVDPSQGNWDAEDDVEGQEQLGSAAMGEFERLKARLKKEALAKEAEEAAKGQAK